MRHPEVLAKIREEGRTDPKQMTGAGRFQKSWNSSHENQDLM